MKTCPIEKSTKTESLRATNSPRAFFCGLRCFDSLGRPGNLIFIDRLTAIPCNHRSEGGFRDGVPDEPARARHRGCAEPVFETST